MNLNGSVFKIGANKNYECLDEESQVVIAKRIKAKEYWNEIIKSAHSSAEPGIIFEDNHHSYSGKCNKSRNHWWYRFW